MWVGRACVPHPLALSPRPAPPPNLPPAPEPRPEPRPIPSTPLPPRRSLRAPAGLCAWSPAWAPSGAKSPGPCWWPRWTSSPLPRFGQTRGYGSWEVTEAGWGRPGRCPSGGGGVTSGFSSCCKIQIGRHELGGRSAAAHAPATPGVPGGRGWGSRPCLPGAEVP